MTFRIILLSIFFLFTNNLFSQTFTVKGIVVDEKDNSSIISVSVQLVKIPDSSIKTGTVTDASGNFEIAGVSDGKYLLKLDYVGYRKVVKMIDVVGADNNVGTLKMKSLETELKGVTVTEKQIRAEQKEDTSSFKANAFKTHPDATAEDLVNKMPGITSDNSGVKVNGETVQKVTVDGKPFFGTDPTLALKNLPAEVIDKIQIFDKLSDQAAFTGFDDGSSQKTMNIVTRGNKSEGVFGKAFAGYGTDDRYLVGGNLNIFHGEQRISLLGLTNNVNQQNFSSQDLLGISGGGGNRGGFGGGRGSFGGGMGGGGFGGGNNNFMVGQQGGITATNSAGINYSDSWGKKIKVSGSYFFNNTNNTTATDLTRNYTTGSADSTNIYHEYDNSSAKNYNHRFNLRLEYTIDSFNSIIFTPGVSFQNNNTTNSSFANDSLKSIFASSTNNNTIANSSGYSSSNNILFQHKFKKQRRTVSFNLGVTLNEKTGDGNYFATNLNADSSRNSLLKQAYNSYNHGTTLTPNVTYTEPIGEKGQLMFTYNPSFSQTGSRKITDSFNDATQLYDKLSSALSNQYNTDYNTQKGGVSYRLGNKKMNFNVGVNVQYATLTGDQQFPNLFSLKKNFIDLLPSAFYNYRFTDGRNLRIMYRASTQAPSISQLENVLDNSNPLLLKTGNAQLRQDYEHTLTVRYGLTDPKKARNFFLNLYANYANNYIGNATYNDSVFHDDFTKTDIRLTRGSQLTRPVNLNGYFNSRLFLTYSIPMLPIKSNLNLSGGLNFTRTPELLNTLVNYANNYIPTGGLVLSSNISENLDFTLSYFGNYNIVKNTAQTMVNNNYYNHTAAFKINYIFLKHFVLNTNITENYYTAFSSTANQDFYQWNAYVGYKFLKGNALEARISAFDILNQNRSINRTVTASYIENSTTQVLKQYFMLQLTYTIRNFKGTMPTEEGPKDRPMMPPGGMWPGGGGRHDHGGGF